MIFLNFIGLEDNDPMMMMAMMNSLADSGKSSKYHLYGSTTDKLDLSGLLNVLDGVVDCPNRFSIFSLNFYHIKCEFPFSLDFFDIFRILVMTSNHPEKLDPALIRPGRIDKKMFLGYMGAKESIEMTEHYFQTTLNEVLKKKNE